MHAIRRFSIVPLVLALAACSGDGQPTDPLGSGELGPAMDISDAAHLPGRDGFFFLPPMVVAPSFSGVFDPDLSPEVRVCELPDCTTIIKTFNSTSAGAEMLTVDVGGESYVAVWNTKKNPNNLQTGADKYRLEVWVGGQLIGYADLWFVNKSKDLSIVTSEYVGIVKGSPLVIKFRIETGVIGTIEVVADPDHIVGSGTSSITATVTDLHGEPVVGATVDWESSNTNVASLDPASSVTNADGEATTTASTESMGGMTTITARTGGAEGSTTLEVTLNAPPLAEDDDYTVAAGGTLTAPDAGPPIVPGILENDFLGVPEVLVVSSIDIGGGPLTLPQADLAFAGGLLTVDSDGGFTLASPTEAGDHTFTYTLDNGIPPASTATVTITVTPGAAAKLAIVTQPSSTAMSGVEFAQQPVIRIVDAFDNPVAVAGTDITAAIATGTGTLGGTAVVATDADGIATFDDLSITGAAGEYTLSFSATGLTGVTSDAITLGAGAAEKLAFTVQPSNTAAGADITPAVQVTIQDGGGNTVPSTANVTIAIGNNPSTGILSGTLTVAAVAGVATFSDLSIDKVGTGYTLAASSSGLTGATSDAFDIEAGPVAKFLVEAAGGGDIQTQTSGAPFSIDITALDAGDNVVTAFAGTVDVSATGATLSAGAGTTAAFVGGMLTHSVTFGTAGDTVTITVTRTGGSETGTSNEFTVQGAPVAVDDNHPSVALGTSSPGSTDFHIDFEGESNGIINVLDNDNLGIPAATTRTFGNIQLNGGTAIGGAVTNNAFGGSPVDLGSNGSLAVETDGDVNLSAPDGFTGLITFDYRLENTIGSDDATVTIAVGERPAALDNNYPNTLVGNISINTATGTPFSVTADDAGDGLTVTLVGGSATNGEATVNADGTFEFNPAAGFRGGNGTFQYEISNGFGSSAANVTIPVGTQVIWFIDNGAAECTTLASGCGRLSDPFNTLAAFHAINNGTGNNPADNHHIFVYQSMTGYTGGLTLRSGQRLIGQDATSTLLALSGVTLPAHSPELPAMNSGDATKTTFDGAAGGIALNSGNHLHGFTASPSTGAGVSGATVGSLVVRDVAVNAAAGPAVDLTSGTVDAIFTGVSSVTSTTRNVNLVSINGTVNLAGGSLAGSTGEAFRISGGTANVSYSGSITNASNKSVSISGKTGGLVSLTGAITDTGTGIDLTTNTGATIRFAGGLSLSTGANPAFAATGGGTVEVCDENPCNAAATGALVNSITTTTGTALNVASTNIGAANLEFSSISAGTVASGPTNGIVLNTTGTTGGLKVKGTGTAGTGGTIQRTTGVGILLSSTSNASFSFMNVQNGGDDGIRGSTVNNLALQTVSVTSNGDAVGDHGIELSQLTGTGSMANVAVSGSGEHNVSIANTSGTLSAFNVTNSSFTTTNVTTGGDGFLVENNGTGAMTVSITGSTFTDNKGDHFQAATTAGASGSTNFTFSNNTLTTTAANDPNVVGGGITVSPSGSSDFVFMISNNNLQQAFDEAINLNLGTASTAAASMIGTVSGNIIGTAGEVDSGSESGSGISVISNGAGLTTVAITNNQVRQYANPYGILINTKEGDSNLNATVTGNTVANPGSFALNGIRIDAGATAGDGGTLCAAVTGNSVAGSGPGAETDIRLRQRFETTIRLPGYAGANSDVTAVNAFVAGNNAGADVSSAHNVGGGGFGFVGGAACITP